jgi:hypothetical protein
MNRSLCAKQCPRPGRGFTRALSLLAAAAVTIGAGACAHTRSPSAGATVGEGGASEAVGALPVEVILKVIRDHAAAIQGCYEAQRSQSPDLTGTVQIGWVIGETGEVIKVEVAQTTLSSPAVETCITNQVKTWLFPPPNGGRVVTMVYPWTFGSN